MSIFGEYADFYDALYKDKNYKSECNALEEIFQKYGKKRISSILDLGCGTGNHALILHKKGYKVLGVDRSSVMLKNAAKKLKAVADQKNIRFQRGDLRNWKTDEKFDAAIMMFAVLGYQITNEDVLKTLFNVRRHLDFGGLFVFDVWYGPAVLMEKPSKRVKTVNTSYGQIRRLASSEIDTFRQTCTVHYTTMVTKDKPAVKTIKEDHQMRYFFPQELALFLNISDLELIKLSAFPNWEKEPDEKTWNVLGVARAT